MTSAEPAASLRAKSLVLFAILSIAMMTPIRSYDFFWHLAAGRWIAEHRALPVFDPFTLSSDRIPWIDGEWLFQLGAWAVHAMGGDLAISVARGVVVAAIFALAFFLASREADPQIALFASAVGLWGADHRLTARPESVATLFLVIAIALLLREVTRRTTLAFVALCVVWMSVHPSALLAPVLAGLVALGAFAAGGPDAIRGAGKRLGLAALGVVALVVNPWHIEGVLAPLRLARQAGSGNFVNMEWTATRFSDFPLLYLVVPVALILLGGSPRRRELLPCTMLFVVLAALAFRYVRNHGFFYAAMPLLMAPALPRPRAMRLPLVGLAAAIVIAMVTVNHGGIGFGADEERFPVTSVWRVQKLGLRGNAYNPDQLGGYLVWSFYPERRALTDGRNELHATFIDEYAKARLNERAWHALIAKYRLVLAVDEYHRETMEVVDGTTGERRTLPSSLIYFPRSRWALVAFDDVAMVFARRDAFDAALLEKIEYRTLVPDGATPLTDDRPETVALARSEIRRARFELCRCKSVERIARALGE